MTINRYNLIPIDSSISAVILDEPMSASFIVRVYLTTSIQSSVSDASPLDSDWLNTHAPLFARLTPADLFKLLSGCALCTDWFSKPLKLLNNLQSKPEIASLQPLPIFDSHLCASSGVRCSSRLEILLFGLSLLSKADLSQVADMSADIHLLIECLTVQSRIIILLSKLRKDMRLSSHAILLERLQFTLEIAPALWITVWFYYKPLVWFILVYTILFSAYVY